MRWSLIPLLILPILTMAQARGRMDASSSRILEELIRSGDPSGLSERYPVYRIGGKWHVSLCGRLRPDPDWESIRMLGGVPGSQAGRVATLKFPLESLSLADFSSVFEYLEVPSRAHPDLFKVRYDTGTDSVFEAINLPQRFDGEGVMIGITDWGFDYTHPMFLDTLMQESRIAGVWDQYRQSGPAPSGFGYGTAYLESADWIAAQTDTANIYSYHTHGTHVAGIAAGGGAGTEMRGIAPASDLLFATFLIDYASVIDAYNWMKQIATLHGKRLVINQSWGLHYMGTLDGQSLLSQAIDALSEEGVVFVSSGGNNGGVNFHLSKTFAADTAHTRVQFDSFSIPHYWGQSVTLWGEPGQSFSVRLRVLSGNNVELAGTPWLSSQDNPPYLDSLLVVNGDTLLFNLATDAAHPLNSRPHMRLRVRNTNGLYKVVLSFTGPSGTVHAWNVAELTTGVGNWGLAFLNPGGAGGLAGNDSHGIAEPACAGGTLAVAAYTASYPNSSGNLSGGQIAGFSSKGPLITGAMKPDLAAPGVQVASSVSSFTDASYSPTETISHGGTSYDFARFSGTSMAAPCVSGIAALVLQANPLLTAAQVRDILKSSAREDEDTGDLPAGGHVRWGYGKVSAYRAVLMALATEGLGATGREEPAVRVFPNPTSGRLRVSTPGDRPLLRAWATDLSGRSVSLDTGDREVSLEKLAPGAYALQLIWESGGACTRVMRVP